MLVESSTLCAMDICLMLPQCTERVPAPGQRPVVTSHGNTALWAGVHRDLDTGWDWMGARVYLPELRQFLSRDPAGYSVSFDEWAYTPGDPWNYLDRSGWSPDKCGNPGQAGCGKQDPDGMDAGTRDIPGIGINDMEPAGFHYNETWPTESGGMNPIPLPAPKPKPPSSLRLEFELRSFAGPAVFGLGFLGDDRGFSTESGASARSFGRFTLDFSSVAEGSAGSFEVSVDILTAESGSAHILASDLVLFGSPGSSYSASAAVGQSGQPAIQVSMSIAAGLPFLPPGLQQAGAINHQVTLLLEPNFGTNTFVVSGIQFSGDDFPNFEVIGNGEPIVAFETPYNTQTAPFYRLFPFIGEMDGVARPVVVDGR
jgi:RHS repeat-associated protein